MYLVSPATVSNCCNIRMKACQSANANIFICFNNGDEIHCTSVHPDSAAVQFKASSIEYMLKSGGRDPTVSHMVEATCITKGTCPSILDPAMCQVKNTKLDVGSHAVSDGLATTWTQTISTDVQLLWCNNFR
jgi:hypothetical protein